MYCMYTVGLFFLFIISSFMSVKSSQLLSNLRWRSALKTFLPATPSIVDIKPILEAIRLAPSSYGLQPYNLHIVTNQEVKKRLRDASYNQAQVTECSHLIVFCARNDGHEVVERFISDCDIEKLAPEYSQSLRSGGINKLSKDECLHWATNQAFIALGFGVIAAAEEKIGSCPMSGFVAADVHRVLQLPENQWPVAYLAIGSKNDNSDQNSGKIRFRISENELCKFHR